MTIITLVEQSKIELMQHQQRPIQTMAMALRSHYSQLAETSIEARNEQVSL